MTAALARQVVGNIQNIRKSLPGLLVAYPGKHVEMDR
jgi:hypothetical protein